MKRSIIMMVPFALLACATPEARVRTALRDAGVPVPIATCMAQRMVDRLTLAQLQKLSRLSGVTRERLSTFTIAELLRRTRTLDDPRILSVVTTAGLGCAIAS